MAGRTDDKRHGSGGEEPGREQSHGPVGQAVATSVHGNATAFGFSIMITATFGALTTIEGSGTVAEILLFGVGAALSVALLEGIVSRGFRVRSRVAHAEVRLLGTALNVASVSAGVGAAIGTAELVDGAAAWPLASFAAALVYVVVESAEIGLAELVQKARGDTQAEGGRQEG
ncbi:hypothetical protein [Conexibacter arvalis]|uniref:Uncharacterized protein n=1 Tax=Conexibacter arvalis TaxID=912552 RepID=A0A840IB42_9ACTN|nr:hypothetical protein [Conexibacter arvalis]MBB4662137.1 hypothetical protein [Conexibacter arvalis]